MASAFRTFFFLFSAKTAPTSIVNLAAGRASHGAGETERADAAAAPAGSTFFRVMIEFSVTYRM